MEIDPDRPPSYRILTAEELYFLREVIVEWCIDKDIEYIIPYIEKCDGKILIDIYMEEPIVAMGILAANFS